MSNDTETPTFDPNAPHQQRPRLRPIRGFQTKQGDQVILGLTDARQISDRVVYTMPQAQVILPHLTGENDIDAIVEAVGRGLQRPMLEQLVAQLDHAGLLEGPRFESILTKMREDFDSSPVLPPSSTAQFADALVVQELGEEATDEQKAQLGPEKLRKAFDKWMKDALDPAPDPSFDKLPRAIFAPHLDYFRGWFNYAHAYGRMRVVDRPDRIIILGTNHHGMGTGVVGSDKGYASPLGELRYDEAFASTLAKHLGEDNTRKLFENRYDHEREHSVEVHIPWIIHVFGQADKDVDIPVFACLVHDPCHNSGESYDGNGLALDPFIEAMRKAIDEAPGRTLVISSADLSHIGASFGDETPIVGDSAEAAAFRDQIVKTDQAALKLIENASPDELIATMAWAQNATRWCSIGNIVATLKITQATSVKMLHYTISGDQQGVAAVSSFSAAAF